MGSERATTPATAEQLAYWRYQCEERRRRWAEGRAVPEWHLTVHETLQLLDDLAATAKDRDDHHEVNVRFANDVDEQAATIERLEAALLTATDVYKGHDEHPRGYEGPCFCDLCLSYGAEDGALEGGSDAE